MNGPAKTSRRDRAHLWITAAIVTVNTVPFAPIYPESTYDDHFLVVWLGFFLFASAPFWAGVVGLWRLNRRRSPAARSAIAESPGVLQVMLFLPFFWGSWWILSIPVLRTVDGILLYRLALDQRRADSGTPAVARIDEGI